MRHNQHGPSPEQSRDSDGGATAEATTGLSTQDTGYQQEAVQRLHLPYSLLSDAALELIRALRLPTFEAAGQTRLRRFTLVISNGVIEHTFFTRSSRPTGTPRKYSPG
ncbi:redoxin family protein [Streptomyces sp. NPDC001984]|uniref:redoxin family protein n=1 Tax=Streptomyces sp. NPDC002619 TaxID=3364655 RepID=UPI0036BE9C94